MTRRNLALALLAAIVLCGCDQRSTSEHGPIEPPPAATTVPWWQDGVLHVAGAAIAIRRPIILFRGGTTVVGRSGSHGSSWSLVVGNGLTPLIRTATPMVPAISSDGRRIAWVQEVRSRRLGRYRSNVDYLVVAYDVRDRARAGTWRTTHRVVCCDAGGMVEVLGIDLDGRVVLSSLGGWLKIWTPGRAPADIHGPGAGRISEPLWPGGLTWQGKTRHILETPGRYGTIDASGLVHRAGSMPTDQLGLWAPDGESYVYPGTADGRSPAKATLDHYWVRSTDDARPVELEVPRADQLDAVAWEDTSHVVLEERTAGDRPHQVALVRCDARSGRCEQLARPDGRAVLPDPYL